jgi:hypothetical protein
MEDNTVLHLPSILDSYTVNYGRINIQVKNSILYHNDILCHKNTFNLKLGLVDLEHILSIIEKSNKYVIHIINTIHNPSDLISYNKTLFIDNYGNIYSAYTSFFDYKEASMYPHKVNLNTKKIEYPSNLSVYPLPDFMVDYIKNINNSFLFTIVDYTNPIVEIISKLNEFSHYFYEFKQETIKNRQIIQDKNNMLLNIIDNEITDYRKTHDAKIASMQQVVNFLEHEAIINQKLYQELEEKYQELNNKTCALDRENNKYKKNIFIRISQFFKCFCCKSKAD